MSFEPNATQSLALWRMIAGATPEQQRPMLGQIKPLHRRPLLKHGFLEQEAGKSKKGRNAQFLVLTDKAWEWASHARDAKFNRAPTASYVLQELIRRLVPFLERRDIALAELFREDELSVDDSGGSSTNQRSLPRERLAPGAAASSADADLAGESVQTLIERACLSLAGGAKKSRVRLSALRRALPAIPRQQLDAALIDLQRERRLVLYREDNTPALTTEDHSAALMVGNSPRHLVYLEA
jgi:hypothetical protein